MAKTIYTIGYSTHSIDDFLEILFSHEIQLLVDIRAFPHSKNSPDFNTENLKDHLEKHQIEYQHSGELGGRRKPQKDSINTSWKNPAFRGFADYMQTLEFQNAIDSLQSLAEQKRTAIMCAEGVPWRCHRNLIADFLTYKKWKVLHIYNKKSAKLHKRTPFSRIKKGKIIYDLVK